MAKVVKGQKHLMCTGIGNQKEMGSCHSNVNAVDKCVRAVRNTCLHAHTCVPREVHTDRVGRKGGGQEGG